MLKYLNQPRWLIKLPFVVVDVSPSQPQSRSTKRALHGPLQFTHNSLSSFPFWVLTRSANPPEGNKITYTQPPQMVMMMTTTAVRALLRESNELSLNHRIKLKWHHKMLRCLVYRLLWMGIAPLSLLDFGHISARDIMLLAADFVCFSLVRSFFTSFFPYIFIFFSTTRRQLWERDNPSRGT